MKYFSIFLFLLVLVSVVYADNGMDSQDSVLSVTPEFRGLWITRFEWPSQDEKECKDKIVEIFDAMEKANFNAAVFQMRGCAETLYPSTLEPWSRLVDNKDPGFDPFKFAVDEAHKRGLEFHTYINPIPMLHADSATPPHTIPEHMYNLHGPESEEPWVCMDEDGKIMEYKKAGYYYFSPGIPEVQEHLRKVIRDIVSRYDIDGLHLDRIRYPGPEYSHDPVSEQRFYERGNPNRREWADWQREQLDKFINDVYAEVNSINPHVIMSCAAWGIYNRYNIEGYYGFSSGYHDYYQDTWEWIKLGAMDYLMPMIYWDLKAPKPNYDEVVKDFKDGIGAERLVGGQRCYGRNWASSENIDEITVSRKEGIAGTVLFSYNGAKRNELFDKLVTGLYSEKAQTPECTWKTHPQTGIIMGTVLDKSGNPVKDAWVSLLRDSDNPRNRSIQTWPSGSDGRFAFLKIPDEPLKIVVDYDGAGKVELNNVQVMPGEVKKIDVVLKEDAKDQVFFHIFSPEDGSETGNGTINILGRTNPENKISIEGEEIPVYITGGFAKDNISLKPGENKIEIKATDKNGKTTIRYYTITKTDREEGRRWREREGSKEQFSVREPAQNLSLLPGDVLEIMLSGPSGWTGYAKCLKKFKVSLSEINEGQYYASIKIPEGFKTKEPYPIDIRMKPDRGKSIKQESKATVEVWDSLSPLVGETTSEKSGITFGTHSVRLGGPYLSEIPEGIRFEIIGKKGRGYKIKLSKSMTGWIDEENVKILPKGTPIPHAYFTSCSISGNDKYDQVSFYPTESIVYAISSQSYEKNYLYLDFFNTHLASTWNSHKTGSKIVGNVKGEQMEEDWVRFTIPVNCKQIWGYWIEKNGNGIILNVKRPPEIAGGDDSPVKGLLFALEAGHGKSNTGAVGTMGTKEKTINFSAVKAVQKVLEEKGAKTVLVRPGDSNPYLSERVQAAIDAGADFYLSIHANAAGTSRGFLRVSGTSTYYRDDHCYLAAKKVYDELLKLDWGEFGVVGNFNYSPLRSTNMPSILVEQAFMSNPYDEARLLDPDYQAEQAKAIVKGLEEFLNEVRE